MYSYSKTETKNWIKVNLYAKDNDHHQRFAVILMDTIYYVKDNLHGRAEIYLEGGEVLPLSISTSEFWSKVFGHKNDK